MRCRSCKPIPEEVRRAADLLERRWTVSIIWASHSGAVRFGEFMQALGGISPATLAARLGELEQAGVLERQLVDSRPPRAEYHLTERGLELRDLVAALRRLAEVQPIKRRAT
jgi:DNA-binding HxlR family transcriptional regulator